MANSFRVATAYMPADTEGVADPYKWSRRHIGLKVFLAQTAGPAAGGLLYAVTPAGHWTACVAISIVAALLILGARARPAVSAELTRSPGW
ncbi:hypothetical protein AB0K21_44500 [Streptosporangium sp. NPDC049248]|uniref:hypothetical protein n=1 Tax=Streptosporangium sp. NPDC049248 TaxID=3155651 RepID=UPI003423E99D